MVETILNITQLEARQGERGFNQIDMTELLREVVTEQRPNADMAKVSLELLMKDEPLVVTGDYMDYTRIWRNLLSNAIKYTPEQGKVILRMACLSAEDHNEIIDSPWLEVAARYRPCLVGQIEDTGHGIQAEDLEDLFRRFHRGWAKYSNIPGTGLGLPLVRELLTIYGGDIHVSSSLEQGSIFTFWIPIEED
jgi:signal transduction histidine kinase